MTRSFGRSGLPSACDEDSVRAMRALHSSRRNSTALIWRRRVSTLCGLLALLGVTLLTTWHDTLPQAHAGQQVASSVADHDHHHDRHESKDQPDLADMMHIAAHAAHQSTDLPSQPVIVADVAPVAGRWELFHAAALGSTGPASLLRPPEA